MTTLHFMFVQPQRPVPLYSILFSKPKEKLSVWCCSKISMGLVKLNPNSQRQNSKKIKATQDVCQPVSKPNAQSPKHIQPMLKVVFLFCFVLFLVLQVLTKGGVTYKDEVWHKECFLCTGCKAPLAGQPFTSQGDSPYCVKCFSSLYAKKCAGCNTAITGQSVGVSTLLALPSHRGPFWRLCDSSPTRLSTVSQQTGVS